MKKYSLLFILIIIFFSGCDAVYRYVFLPPERVEYTIVPDPDAIKALGDTNYFVSRDGRVIGYDAKDWKVEVMFMSDYQLNNFEFPDDSKAGEFSSNPFTFGNWTDPNLGFTPRRFSVFKVSIYNYTGSKINFDPEMSIFETDRGDYLNAYGREEKNARYHSIEQYYRIRKGSSGLDDEVYERRMGIARRTMLYYGKAIYRGDSREGLLVFDPVLENLKKMRVIFNGFVTEYDENNEPSEFKHLEFFFKQVPVTEVGVYSVPIATDEKEKKEGELSGEVKVVQLKYNAQAIRTAYMEPWNPVPRSLPSLLNYTERNTGLTTRLTQTTFDDPVVKDADIAFIFGGGAPPAFTTGAVESCAEYLLNGGFLFIDNTYLTADWPYVKIMEDFLTDVKTSMGGNAEIKRINLDHRLFSSFKQLSYLPKGYDELVVKIDVADHIKGLFHNGKLVAVLSTKGYPRLWATDTELTVDIEAQLEFGLNLIIYAFKDR